MRDGYGFGAEGDWKTAAMVRAMKVMSSGLPGGVSFMEDYTYHLDRRRRPQSSGAHMLEVCESIAGGRPRLEIHPALHRRQGGPGPARVRRPSGDGRPRLDRRHGPALPDGRDRRGRRRPGAAAAEAPGRPRPLASPARPQDERGRLDLRRRLAPHEPWLRGDARASARTSRRCPGSSSCSSTSTTALDRVPGPAPLERPLLPPRTRPLTPFGRPSHAGRTGISSHGPARDPSPVRSPDPCHRLPGPRGMKRPDRIEGARP